MKQIFFVCLLFALLFSFSSCGSSKPAEKNLDISSSEEKKPLSIDYDFTKMNFNIATAQIFNMTVEADKYLGKVVKFQGQFMSIEEEGYTSRFFSVLQYDATACCQTGFMFFLPEDKKYPDDYPAEMSDIEVCGKLTKGEVDGMEIIYLACDNYTLLEGAE